MTDVRRSVAGGVMELALARPAKKNAITGAMYAALAEALADANADANIQCVLFSGDGDDFCSGNDLIDFMQAGTAALDAEGPTLRFLHALADSEVVLAAAVQGRAVGVGATLLFHCDLVALAPDASLTLPFVKLGLTPEAGSSLLLPALIGHRVAAEMVLLGRPVSAERALALGMANLIDADPLGAARAMAQEAARQPASALRQARRLLRQQGDTLKERIDSEAGVFLRQLQTPEFQAQAMAFFAARSRA
jgi:enoyl-CoA hydratase/carnithine racemase